MLSAGTAVVDLEREVGLEIFDRSARQLAITADGLQVVARARAAVVAFDDAVREMTPRPPTCAGRCAWGSPWTPGPA